MSKDKRLTATLLVRLDSSSFQQPPDARKAGSSLPDPQCLLLSWKRGSKKLNQGLAELISPVAISLNCNFFEKSPPKSTTGSPAAAVCYHPKNLLLALLENSAAPAGDAKKRGRSRAKKGRMVGSSTVDLAEWAASPGRSVKRVLFSNGLLCDLLVEVTWTHYHGKRLVSQAGGPAPACKSTLTVGDQEFGLMTEAGGSHGEGSDPDTTANFSSDEDRDLDGGFGDKSPGSNSPDSRSESRSKSERESRNTRKREPSGAVRRSVSRSSFGTKPNLEAQINVDFVGLEGKNAQSCLSLSWKRGDKKSNSGSKPLPSTPERTEGFVVVSKFVEKAPSKPDSAIAGESQARSFRPKGLDLSLLQLAEDAAAKKSKPAVIGTQVVDLSEWVANPGQSQQRIVFSNGTVLRAVVTVTWKKYNGKKVVPASAAGPSSAQPGAFKSTIAVGSDEFGLVTETDNLSDGDDSELDSVFDDDEPNDDLSRSQSSLGGPSSSSRGARSSHSKFASSSDLHTPKSKKPQPQRFSSQATLLAEFLLEVLAVDASRAGDQQPPPPPQLSLSWSRGGKRSSRGSLTLSPQGSPMGQFILAANFFEALAQGPDAALSFRGKKLSLVLKAAQSKAAKKQGGFSKEEASVDLAEWAGQPGAFDKHVVFPSGLILQLRVTVSWKKFRGKKVVALAPSASSRAPAAFKSTVAVGAVEFGLVTETDNLSDGSDQDITANSSSSDDGVLQAPEPDLDAPPSRHSIAFRSRMEAIVGSQSSLKSSSDNAINLRGSTLGATPLSSAPEPSTGPPPLPPKKSSKSTSSGPPPRPPRAASVSRPRLTYSSSSALDVSVLKTRALVCGPPNRRPPSKPSSRPSLNYSAPQLAIRSSATSTLASTLTSIGSDSAEVISFPPSRRFLPSSESPADAKPPVTASEITQKLFTGKSKLSAQFDLQFSRAFSKTQVNATPPFALSWKRGYKPKNQGSWTVPAAAGVDLRFSLSASLVEQAAPKKAAANFQPRFQPKLLHFTMTPQGSSKGKPGKGPAKSTVSADLSEWVLSAGSSDRELVFSDGTTVVVRASVTWLRLNGKKVVPCEPLAAPASGAAQDFGLLTDNEELSDDLSDVDDLNDEGDFRDTAPSEAPRGILDASSSSSSESKPTPLKRDKKRKPKKKSNRQSQGSSSKHQPGMPTSSSRHSGGTQSSPAILLLSELRPPPPPNLEKLLCRDCGSSVDFDLATEHMGECSALRAKFDQRIQSQAEELLRTISGPRSEDSDLRLANLVLSLEPAERSVVLNFPEPTTKRTLLMSAVIKGNLLAAQVLLQCGVNINLRDATMERKSALDLAASTGNVKILLDLLRAGAVLPTMGGHHSQHHSHVHSNQRASPLHYAVRSRCYEACIALLEHKIDPSFPDQLGKTPLHLAIEMKNPRMVATLVRHGASPTRPGGLKQTPLQVATKLGYPQCLRALQGCDPADLPESEVSIGDSPTGAPTSSSSRTSPRSRGEEDSEKSVEEGTDINLDSSSDDELALAQEELSFQAEQQALFRESISKLASPSSSTFSKPPVPPPKPASRQADGPKRSVADMVLGETSRDQRFEAQMRMQNRLPQCPIDPKIGFSNLVHRFVLAGDWEALRNFEERIDRLDKGVTPLFLCAYASSFQKECASELLSMGANINFEHDKSGWTALHAAAHRNQPQLIELLIQRGINISARTLLLDESLLTVISEKLSHFTKSTQEMLQIPTTEAPPPPKVYEGYSALDLAIGYKSMDAVRMLKRYKAPAFKFIYAYRVKQQ